MRRKRTWSTARRVSDEELRRIEEARRALNGHYGRWQQFAAETDLHYNSIMRFANGLTIRPSKHLLAEVERVLKKKHWREAPAGI